MLKCENVGGVRKKTRRYKLKPASLGEVSPGHDLDKALALAELLEDAKISSKLAR